MWNSLLKGDDSHPVRVHTLKCNMCGASVFKFSIDGTEGKWMHFATERPEHLCEKCNIPLIETFGRVK